MSTSIAQPWVEKHRPKVIKDVAHQEEVISTLTKSIETANMPHLLFYGPPGTGKTTTALAVGRQLYGPNLFSQRVMELNASDERGIAIVRDKIKMFASSTVGAGDPDYPSPPYKLLILDEADSMTADAQNALRRIMETHSAVTRFCFICNYVSRIIEPLASRCAKFRFKPLHEGIMEDRVNAVAAAEGVKLGAGAMAALGRVSNGDLRRALTTLQSAYALYDNPVMPSTIIDVAGEVPLPLIEGLMTACKQPALEPATTAVGELLAEGFGVSAVLEPLLDLLLADPGLSDAQKASAVAAMASADKCLTDGADGFLQLCAVASELQQLCNGRTA
eukprot:jgi/Ulvmu1/8528/UM044_0062.1